MVYVNPQEALQPAIAQLEEWKIDAPSLGQRGSPHADGIFLIFLAGFSGLVGG